LFLKQILTETIQNDSKPLGNVEPLSAIEFNFNKHDRCKTDVDRSNDRNYPC